MEEMRFDLVESFAELPDPRIERKKLHALLDIVVIAICAVICGAEGWEDIESFAERRLDWLKRFLPLPNGVPHHDTFRRVFERINPSMFEACFQKWVRSLCQIFEQEVVAIDGKTARRSYSHKKDNALGALHLVSAWACEQSLVLGQVRTQEKSNEITAIPELLDLLELKGAIVTIDAMGCQKKIAEKIVHKKADYVLAVKENQGNLHAALVKTFEEAQRLNFEGMVYDTYVDKDCGHGRMEERKCIVLPLMYLYRFKLKWKGLQSLICLESKRVNKRTGEITFEKRYYISSLPMEAKRLLMAIRKHWGIENQVHWCLDMIFREDDSRIRDKHSAQNFAILRRLVMNMLRLETSLTASLKRKRYIATMDVSYLEKVLQAVAAKPAATMDF